MKRTALAPYLLFLLLAALPSSSSAESLATATPSAQKPGRSDCAAAKDHIAARPDDSLWMISTRCLGCSCGDKQAELDLPLWRYDGDSGWQETDWSDWSAAEQPGTTTVVYVHGNRVEAGEAGGRGLAAYRALTRNASDLRPIRFVMWSWPSAKLKGPRPKRDAQVKAARTPCQSYYLAHFLTRLNPDTQLSLLGYSFGVRIISGALHLADGGALGCLKLTEAGVRPAHSVRVALLAGGMNNDWWLPGHYHDQAWSAVDRLCLLYNTCDPVLRFYPRLDRRSGAQALGRTGFCWTASLGDDAWRLEQANVCCEIGKTHDEDAYFASDAVMCRVGETLLVP
jgi:hypothetical protein